MVNQRIKNLTRIIRSICPLVLLVGCSGLNSKFNCNKRATDSCQSIFEINKKVQAGLYEQKGVTRSDKLELILSQNNELVLQQSTLNYKNKNKIKNTENNKNNKNNKKPENNSLNHMSPTNTRSNLLSSRHPEQLQAIWIAPYQDRYSNYHGSSLIYTVIKPAYWRL